MVTVIKKKKAFMCITESACGLYVYDRFLKLCLKRIFSQLQNNTARYFFSPSPIPIERELNSWFCVFLSMLLSPMVLRGVHLTFVRMLRGHKPGGEPLWRRGKSTITEVTQWSQWELCHDPILPLLHLYLCISPDSPHTSFYFILSIPLFQNVIHFLKGACSIQMPKGIPTRF